VSGSGQLGGGPEGGITPKFRTPLKSRILESLELTPVGASVMASGPNDAMIEQANALTANEGSEASMSPGDEAADWTLQGGSGNPERLGGRCWHWPCDGGGVEIDWVGAAPQW
jgi:hypothetical protein